MANQVNWRCIKNLFGYPRGSSLSSFISTAITKIYSRQVALILAKMSADRAVVASCNELMLFK